MRRPSRNLEVFTLSALDLFASAMGAFIIITLIIFPYYQKSDPAADRLAALEDQLSEVEATVEEAEAEAVAAIEKAVQAQSLEATPENLENLKDEVANLKAVEEAQQKRLEALAEKYERRIPFSFLGINTEAKSVVVLIDMSSSMMAYDRVMIETVERILVPFDKNIKIALLGFQSLFSDQLRLQRFPKSGMVAATDTAKREARIFVRRLANRFDGRTPTYQALIAALRMKPDAVILISDGAPTNSKYNWQQIVAKVSQENGGQSEIHSVALGNYTEYVELIAFLRDLSSRNKGAFIGIDR